MKDIDTHTVMVDAPRRWCPVVDERTGTRIQGWGWCGGPPVSFFHGEYFEWDEFYPVQQLAYYDLEVNIPHQPWALLNRTYGETCGYRAHLNEHGGIEVDLRDPQYRYLTQPAEVKLLGRG